MNPPARTLYSLWTLIVPAVCHFFCTYDQCYNSRVSYHLTDSVLETIPKPYGLSQLIIIGCGKPVLITPYITATGSAFPVFTGPSGKIYEKIHITRPAAKMRQPPSYLQVSFFRAMGITIKRTWRNRGKAFRRGPSDRNSRRDLFLDRKRAYVRREDHAEQLTAEKLLGILDCDAGKEPLL